MSDQTFVVVGYSRTSELQHVEAIGPFVGRDTADEYIINVLQDTKFKVAYAWRTVWLHDPDMHRRDSDNVPA